MADLPILFSSPMVRAILREIDRPGTGKTQTRRVLHMPPMTFDAVFNDDGVWHIGDALTGHRYTKLSVPYRIDDRLYVREAWRSHRAYDDEPPRRLISPNAKRYMSYVADEPDIHANPTSRYRQAMHMPRWASRITLIVTDVRVQRLQEICEADARAEGVEPLHEGYFPYGITTFMTTIVDGREVPAQYCRTAHHSFQLLWNSLNADRGHGWGANPWVAAYSFRPALGNIDMIGAP